MTEQNGFTEAPASFNVRAISPAGFDCQLTIRDSQAAQLMPRALKALEWLDSKGFQSTTKTRHTNGGNGAASGAPTCQYHGEMKTSKHGGWYCPSKMGDGSYCKEQVNG